MTEALYESDTFEEFWTHYLDAHADPRTQRWHAVATLSAGALIAGGLATQTPWLVLAAPCVDYAIAQASHRRVQGNSTRPWRRPLWHARAELRLCRQTLGRLITQRGIADGAEPPRRGPAIRSSR